MTKQSNQSMTDLSHNPLTRRTVLGGMAASSALLLPGMRTARAETPKPGGRFRIGVSGGATTDSLDPATFASEFMTLLAFSMSNHLIEITAEGDLAGELAESWEASDDAATWRFKLRSGVTFHDGRPLTVDDVILSLRHHMGEDSNSAIKSNLAPITDLSADGDTVVFELEAGNADFPYIFSDYRLPILPAKDAILDIESGIGAGPYRLEAFEPGVRALLTKNPEYWKSDRAHFDEVELVVVLDGAARQNALVTGEVDAITAVEPRTSALMARQDGVQLIEVTGRLHHSWPMRVDIAPFDNVDFRLAIKHALDRQELLDKIHYGRGSVGNDQPISAAYEYWADLEQRTQDLDRARHHFQKSGVSTETPIELHVSEGAYAGAVASGELIVEHLAQAGISLSLVRAPRDGYWSNVWRTQAWCAAFWYGRPTIDWMMTSGYSADSPFNDTGWQNARFNELLVTARSELDRAKRGEMYQEMQTLVRDDAATPITTFANFVMAARDNVAFPDTLSGTYALDGGKAVERWWFSS
ncbi:MAG: ABC transporter substrate-binding protein [Pseudomonadota bacterium]